MPFVSRYVYRNFFHLFWNPLHANATNSQRTLAERSVLCFSDASLRAVKCVQHDLHHHNNLLSNEWCLVRNNGKTSGEGAIYMFISCLCLCAYCIVHTHVLLEHVVERVCGVNADSQGQLFSISAFISRRRNKRKATTAVAVCLEWLE